MYRGIVALGDDVDRRGAIALRFDTHRRDDDRRRVSGGASLAPRIRVALRYARRARSDRARAPVTASAQAVCAASRERHAGDRSRMPASTAFATSSATGSVRARQSSQVSYCRSSRTACEDVGERDALEVAGRHELLVLGEHHEPRALERADHARERRARDLEVARPARAVASGGSPATNLRATRTSSMSASRSRSALVRRTCALAGRAGTRGFWT